MSDNKRIAKNTILLYIRMAIIMGISLYTSRVVLYKLGVDDFGLYNVVCGVVAVFSFISGTLYIGTSRFITYDLGLNNKDKLNETFCTTFYTHLFVGIIFIFLLETIGLWFVYNKLIIPFERLHAAVIAYHISVVTTLVSILQVPYTSMIMAHEKMGVYAYTSIFEAVAKLAIVYCIAMTEFDKLVVYAFLMSSVQFAVTIIYWLYCKFYFIESRLYFKFNKDTFKSLISFSGWNIVANLTETLKLQGYLVLINLFFQPYVVAAQTIANQVAGSIFQFVTNFRTAINPQIIKLYAAKEFEESKNLTLKSTIIVFDMVLLFGLPSIFTLKTIMEIWLVEVPAFAVLFAQYAILQRIISTFDSAFYIPMMASGRIKTNSVLSVFSGPGLFIVLYVIFLLGGSVMWIQYMGVLVILLFSFVFKPIILVREVEGYRYRDFLICFIPCLKVAIMSVGISYIAYLFLGNEKLISSIALFIVSFWGVLVSSYLFLDKSMKEKVKAYLITRIRSIQNL